MGLGKTIQVLALLQRRRARRQAKGPSLVVVPRSLVFNWIAGGRASSRPRLRVLDHTGPGRHALRETFDDYDLILTTYGTLRTDIAELTPFEFDYVILDEAQAIKNAESQSAKAARLLRGRHRLAMSGTPVENHLGELWSIFEFLNPGMLGSDTVFKRHAGGGRDARRATTARLLAKALRPFILRRTKEQVVEDLPEKTEQTLYCDLEAEQRQLYDELRVHYREALLAQGRRRAQPLEDRGPRSAAAAPPGGLPPRPDRPELAQPTASAKLDMLLPVRSPRSSRKGTRSWSSRSSPASWRSSASGSTQEKITYEYLDGRTRNRAAQGRAVPDRPRLPDLPDQPQGRRPGPEPHGRRVRLPARPLVEPRRRGPGHRPLAPDRPDPARLRLPPDLPRHRRGEDPRAPAEEARPGRRHPQRRQQGVIQNLTREDLEFLLS